MRYADSTFHDESYSSLAAKALVIKCQKVGILLKYLGPTYNNLKCLVNNLKDLKDLSELKDLKELNDLEALVLFVYVLYQNVGSWTTPTDSL